MMTKDQFRRSGRSGAAWYAHANHKITRTRFSRLWPLAFATPCLLPSPAAFAAEESSSLPALSVQGQAVTSEATGTLSLNQPNATGSRLGLTPMETPASVDTLEGDTIRARGDLRVDAAVSREAGITMIGTPGNGGTALSARGFTGQAAVMQLFDGVRLYPGAGTVTFPFDTWSTERLEVLHGPASVIYGEGAVGAVVNVVSRQPFEGKIRNEVAALLDTNLTRRLALDSGGSLSRTISYRLDIAGQMSSGYVQRGNSDSLDMKGALRYRPSQDFTVTVSHDHAMQDPMRYYGIPLVRGSLDRSLRDQNYNVQNSILHYEDDWTNLHAEWTPTASLTLRNIAYRLSTNRHWVNAENYRSLPASNMVQRDGYLDLTHQQEQYGDRLDGTWRHTLFGLGNTLGAGMEVNYISFSRFSNAPFGGMSQVPLDNINPGFFINLAGNRKDIQTTTWQVAPFLEDRLQITRRISILAGVRFDHLDLHNAMPTTGKPFDKTYDAPTWRVGVVYQPVQTLSLYGQYSTSVLPPTSTLITTNLANSAFDLSHGRQGEIGIKQDLADGRLQWTFAAYDITRDNLLSADPNNPGVTQQIGQQSSRGLELNVSASITPRWSVNANGSILQARFDDFTETSGGVPVSRNGNTPPNVPLQTANLWTEWAFAPRWQAQAGLRFVGRAFADNANANARPAYTVVDLGLNWQPVDQLSLAARVSNLFDTAYAVTTYGSQQWILGLPRTITFAANVKF